MSGRARYLLGVGLVAAAYFTSARVARSLGAVSGFEMLVWPPTGIALSAIVLAGYRIWPGVALGALLANLATGAPVVAAAGITLGNTLEALVGAFLLRRLVGFRSELERVPEVLGLIFLAGCVATTVSATLGVTSLHLAGVISTSAWQHEWLAWWIGDLLGAVIVAPLILPWSRPFPLTSPSVLRIIEAVLLAAALVAVDLTVFFRVVDVKRWPISYLTFPLLILVAFRFGSRGAGLGAAATATVAAWGTFKGLGPFAGKGLGDGLLLLQSYMGAAAATALVTAAAKTESTRARQEVTALTRGLEEIVRKRTAALNEAQTTAHIGSWEWDVRSDLMTWSDELYRIYGMSPQEVGACQQTFLEGLHPGDRKRAEQAMQHARATCSRFNFEHRIVRPDGVERWLLSQGEMFADAWGKPLRMAGTSQDITDRKQIELALRDRDQQFKGAFEYSAVGAAILSVKGGFLQVNQALCDALGYSPDELVTMNQRDVAHPGDRAGDVPLLRQFLRGRLPFYQAERRFVTRQGAFGWAMVSVSLIRDDQGKPLHFICQAQDVSAAKLAQIALKDSEEKFRRLIETAQEGVWVINADRRTTFVNQRMAGMLGYSVDEMLGAPWLAFTDEEDRADVAANIDRGRNGVTRQHDFRFRRKDGTHMWALLVANPLFDQEGNYLGALSMLTDISERKQTERALREAKERFGAAFESAPIGMALTSTEGRFLQVNRAMCKVTGYAEEELLASQVDAITHPDDRDLDGAHLKQLLAGQIRNYQMEKRYRHAEGQVVCVLVSTSLVTDADGQPLYLISQAEDITKRKQAEERLTHQSLHDPLTGLPNRTLCMDRLRQALARSARHAGSVAVMFIDLDRFKAINDSVGHSGGDRVLASVAERLRATLRPGDTASRLGGDEFMVVCEDMNSEQDASIVADRLLRAMAPPIPLGDGEVVVSASIGISFAGGSSDRPETLVRDADAALYRAKEGGRARWELFNQAMRVRAMERLETENELRRAIAGGELRLYYQALVRVEDRRIVAVEALARWQHPTRGLLAPAEFIALAEETGLIVPLGIWVIEEACRRYAEWRAARPDEWPLLLTVNLSTRQIRQPDFSQVVERALARNRMNPSDLCLEITESVLMEAAGPTITTLEALREIGVRLAIDDFGTGYSSLSYLKRFKVDFLKVDRSFMQGLCSDPEDSAIVAAIVTLAHALRLTVVAEGVETAKQLEQLRALGCDLAQGNYLAPARPPEALDYAVASAV